MLLQLDDPSGLGKDRRVKIEMVTMLSNMVSRLASMVAMVSKMLRTYRCCWMISTIHH